MDCFSQEQNPSYSYEQHKLHKGEDDGRNNYSVTEAQGVSGCTGRYGVGSPEILKAPSTTPNSCIIIWFYLLIWYCPFPLWEALLLSMVILNIFQIHFANTFWSILSKLLCVPGGFVVTVTGRGVVWQFVRGVEKGQVPRERHEGPWPWKRLWDMVGATVLRTEHATCSPAPSPAAAMSEHMSCNAAWPVEGSEHRRSVQHACGKVMAQSEGSTCFL